MTGSDAGGLILHELESAIAAARDAALHDGARITRMLLKTPEVRVLLVAMPRGATWPQHAAAGRVVIRVEAGCIDLARKGTTTRIERGMLASLDPGDPHDVVAVEDSVFLLTVAGG